MNKNQPLLAHLSMLAACAFWGLMSPIGKDAMLHGITGLQLVAFRVAGGALLFWLSSLFAKSEPVPLRHKFYFLGAAVFGLVLNQCGFTIGLSLTSPINASIVTTSMPIFAMVLAAIILREPITSRKVLGVLMGCSGAVALILTSVAAADSKVGDIRGDLMVLGAQFSYALFLSLFRPLVQRYSVFTVNKWMFLWATLLLSPLSFGEMQRLPWTSITPTTWLETAYVVVFGSFVSYILVINAQKVLRPTVISAYNYLQPIIAVIVSVAMGIGLLKWSQALAIGLVFVGVWMVNTSASRRDLEKQR